MFPCEYRFLVKGNLIREFLPSLRHGFDASHACAPYHWILSTTEPALHPNLNRLKSASNTYFGLQFFFVRLLAEQNEICEFASFL